MGCIDARSAVRQVDSGDFDYWFTWIIIGPLWLCLSLYAGYQLFVSIPGLISNECRTIKDGQTAEQLYTDEEIDEIMEHSEGTANLFGLYQHSIKLSDLHQLNKKRDKQLTRTRLNEIWYHMNLRQQLAATDDIF